MGRMLNWIDALLRAAQRRLELHRYRDAYCLLVRVAPAADAKSEDGARLLRLFADCSMHLGKYKTARRCLRRLLLVHRNDPEVHRQLARTIERDPAVDACRAIRHYRIALAHDPSNTECLVEAGRCALDLGRRRLGLAWLRRALELDLNNIDLVIRVIESLIAREFLDDAQALLRQARFRHGRSQRFVQLQSDCEFRAASAQQQQVRNDAAPEVIVLPLVRIHRGITSRKQQWRIDSSNVFKPHFSRRRRRSKSHYAP